MSSEPQHDLTTDNLTADGLRILIIEDMEEPRERLKLTIERTLKSAEVELQPNFEEALKDMLPPRSFEAVVLDLFVGDPEGEGNKQGQRVWEEIWKRKFVPVIIYTGGECDLDPPIPLDNPFVKCIRKSELDSDKIVAEHLRTISPYMFALREVEEELNKVIRSVLAKTSPHIWQSTDADEQTRSELLVRSARRRLAATMDMKTASTDESMLGWEQYIHPPLEDCLLTGDILKAKDAPTTEPASYRLVLTPSCDMQINKGKCKVEQILVAKCTDIGEYTSSVIDNYKVKAKDLTEKLPRYLSEPHQGGFIPLPEYKPIIPCMAADLRALELIPIANIDAIDDTGKSFKRIASVDSPFREHMTWAYLQIVGRPGMPERDLTRWAQDIARGGGATGISPSSAATEAPTTKGAASPSAQDANPGVKSVEASQPEKSLSDDSSQRVPVSTEPGQPAKVTPSLPEAASSSDDEESEKV